jgi:hypothetical protein
MKLEKVPRPAFFKVCNFELLSVGYGGSIQPNHFAVHLSILEEERL